MKIWGVGRVGAIVLLTVCCGVPVWAEFSIKDEGGKLSVAENGKPVFVYNYERVAAPVAVPANFGRACYIHPLYGMDGEVITQDFPPDHFHHRGVFWAWPECTSGDRRMDEWALTDVRPHHEKWLAKEAGADKAEIGAQNVWTFDDAPDTPQVREEVHITVHPADDLGRVIDFDLKLTNVTDKTVTFLGAKNKGYGGFCFRPDAALKPFTFTTSQGVCAEDALRFDTPWADVAWPKGAEGKMAGAAIFEHPKNPGYPFPGWIFRHYAFLGASWPHESSHEMKPGDSFQLRYRMFVHRGGAKDAKVAEAFQAYVGGGK